ncbi:MAG: hypothetical protein ACRDOP_17015, partial [Gaiellaceae bacterium]
PWFGLPLFYFALHGGLVLAERLLAEAGRPIGGRLGRAWSVFGLVAPLLLFHRPFLAGVVWPLVGIPAAGSMPESARIAQLKRFSMRPSAGAW